MINKFFISRPKINEEVYGYLMCGDFQFKRYDNDMFKLKHTWFRIPCIGNTWTTCTEWITEWDCPTEVRKTGKSGKTSETY